MRTLGVVLSALLLTAGLPDRLTAQGAPVRLTMDDAVRRALASGEEVRIAQTGVDQARGQVRQARAGIMPEVRASIVYQRTFASIFQGASGPSIAPFAPDTTAPLDERVRYLENEYDNAGIRGIGGLFANTPFGSENTYTAAITVGQPLFEGGRLAAGIRGARAYERAAGSRFEETRQDVIYRVKQAYLAALFSQRLLDIAEGGRELADSQLHRVQLNFNVGSSADYDLLRARVEVANQEPQVLSARNQRDLALLELRRLVNLPADAAVELEAGMLVSGDSIPDVDLARLTVDAQSRAALDAATAQVEFQRQAVRVYASEAYPRLRFDMSYGGQAFPGGLFPSYSAFRRDWNARLTLSMPLFDGFRTRAQVSMARADLVRAESELAQTREAVDVEIQQARNEVARARALLQARKQTVTWAGRVHHLASVRYTNGIATSLEVSDARLAMQQAQANEAQAMRDYLLGIAALERAMGRTVPVRRVGVQAMGCGVRGSGCGQDNGSEEIR